METFDEDLRKLILLAHRLYIAIPLSNELMQGLELKLPSRPAFRKPVKLNGATPPKMPPIKLGALMSAASNGSNSSSSSSGGPLRPSLSTSSDHFSSKKPKLNIDPTTMTSILAHSQNNEHVCPICNSKYSNVGNFKQHMKTHDNEELREQRNAILSEMIATCFSKLLFLKRKPCYCYMP